jgi:hypothetical protein
VRVAPIIAARPTKGAPWCGPGPPVRTAFVAIALFASSHWSGSLRGEDIRGKLPTLTTAQAAHRITMKDAERHYPVRFQAVVTYYDPYIDPRRPAVFVADASGSVFVGLSRMPSISLQAGELVEVTGVSGAGDFAPIVTQASVRVIGESHLPLDAPRVTMTEMLTGAVDGQWVEIQGIVQAAHVYGGDVVLKLALSDGEIYATTLSDAGVDYTKLVDARVTIRGNEAPLFNRHGQMTGSSFAVSKYHNRQG